MNPVWIIDDDRSIRWVFEKALAREEIPYRSFASAAEALAALDAGDLPQVLVSDIRMPGQSGLDLLRHVKAHYPELPISIRRFPPSRAALSNICPSRSMSTRRSSSCA